MWFILLLWYYRYLNFDRRFWSYFLHQFVLFLKKKRWLGLTFFWVLIYLITFIHFKMWLKCNTVKMLYLFLVVIDMTYKKTTIDASLNFKQLFTKWKMCVNFCMFFLLTRMSNLLLTVSCFHELALVVSSQCVSFFEVFLPADLWVCFLRASCQRSQDRDLPQGEGKAMLSFS